MRDIRGISSAIAILVTLVVMFAGDVAWSQSGACCTCPAICTDVSDHAACDALDGVYIAGGTCEPNSCPGVPANDDQSSPIVIENVPTGEGELLVVGDNICATDDGPPLTPGFSGCGQSITGGAELHDDVWFFYRSEACGDLRIESCNDADFDQMIAVYDAHTGLPLNTEDERGCDDEDCMEPGGPASLTVETILDEDFLIRVGGWNNEIPGGFNGNPRGHFTLHLYYEQVARGASRAGSCTVNLWPAPPPHDIRKNRYISISPDLLAFGVGRYDIRVRLTETLVSGVTAVGSSWWANEPDENCISIVGPTRPDWAPDWSACPTLHLTGCPIIPTSTYEIDPVNRFQNPGPTLVMETQAKPVDAKWWGDCVGQFDPGIPGWTPPQGTVSIDDAVALIRTFQDSGAVNAVHVSVGDLHPFRPSFPPPANQINKFVNIDDVFAALQAYQGSFYPGPEIHLCTDP